MKIFRYLGILGSLLLFVNCGTSKQTASVSSKADHQKPLVIAHRGGSHLAPENTAPAFENAIRLGVDMIEIDIEQTKDGVVIVFHDTAIDRTTQGSGDVDKLSYAYIKTLDAGSHFSNKFKGTKISTLEEVMDQINGRTGLLVEIKGGNERYPGIEEKLVSAIQKRNAYSWVIVQSFNKKSIDRVKNANKRIRTYYLLGRDSFQKYYKSLVAGNEAVNFEGLAVSWKAWSQKSIEDLSKLGIKSFAWTVDDMAAMKKLTEWGINGIITDDPEKLIEILK